MSLRSSCIDPSPEKIDRAGRISDEEIESLVKGGHPKRAIPERVSPENNKTATSKFSFMALLVMILVAFCGAVGLFRAQNDVRIPISVSASRPSHLEDIVTVIRDTERSTNQTVASRRPDDRSCSCYNVTATRTCCRRTVLTAHKFGYELSHVLFRPFSQLVTNERISPGEADGEGDYRHVVIARHVYSAIVSGYLYHKSGRECWLSPYGNPKPNNVDSMGFEWEPMISVDKHYTYPPGRGRSLCRYIAEESEEDGMRVYIDVSMKRWYMGILPYLRKIQRRFQREGVKRTMVICLEELSNPSQKEVLFHEMMRWLFPSVRDFPSLPKRLKEPYSGGHATTHDVELRERLAALAVRLDRDTFNFTLAAMQDGLQCEPTSQ